MTSPQSPVIIRQIPMQRWATKSSLHIYNARRPFNIFRARISRLNVLQLCLAVLGLIGIGYYVYTLVDQYVYQSFQNWAFDQAITGRTNRTFTDYLGERTILGFLTRRNQGHTAAISASNQAAATPAHGAVLGRLQISRLHLSATVREGVDDPALREGVGHVPATALAGQRGNFAITAHRDAQFRVLKEIRSGDLITFQLADGSAYQYRVAATQIVRPSDASVLRADGGGLITGGGSVQGMPKLLTVITCYPFSSVGSAPKRFIVEAKLVEGEEIPNSTAFPVMAEQATVRTEQMTRTHFSRTHRHRRTARSRHRLRRRAAMAPAVS